ncbi:MAG: UbiH/UbiF/VisC/COQ6 family ubiquinone biosynthesis hydroxylase [Pseudomonadota bacterium]
MSEPVREFDVIVVGAGMVGSLFALLLVQDAAAQGLRVAIIDGERSTLPATDAAFDLRVSALTRASEALIARAGCGDALISQRHCRFTDMQVWDADGTGDVHFSAGDAGASHLGTLIENRILQAVLADRLFAAASASSATAQPAALTVLCPARVQSLSRELSGWQVTLADGQCLHAPLLIGADGAQSRVRAAAGIAVQSRDYDQHGLVCTVSTERPHQNTAWQRFLGTGPLAFLPLADPQQCSIVWTQPSADLPELLALSDTDFATRLGIAFEHKLGAITAVGPRAAFPLHARHAERYTQDGLALIGDAAHSIHPLAGQGLNLGLLDAGALADEMLAALRSGLPAGHARALSRYSRQRRGDNALMLHGMTGFERLFASDDLHLRILRNTGMRLFDRSGPLKTWVMRAAMGLVHG